MSICYWAVEGYGVNIEGENFDLEKVAKELNLSPEECEGSPNPFEYLDDLGAQDIIDEMLAKDGFEKHSNYLSFGDTGSNDIGVYIYYTPRYPWNMDEEERNLKIEDIEQMIIDVLLKVSIWDEAEIRSRFENISVGGEG